MDESTDQVIVRRRKLEALRAAGADPFAIRRCDRTHVASEIRERFDELDGRTVTIAGRLREIRDHGKIAFGDVADQSGHVQAFARLDQLGEEHFERFLQLDRGDFISVEGPVLKTKRGEISVGVAKFRLLAKALRPLPKEWHGLRDIEQRYRQRYVDLLVNPATKELFIKRTKIVRAAREVLDERGFLEVETPTLHAVAGGALARPFVTHHNALGIDLYLRIATELHLKRLIVGGFERVYEIGRVFRNEGISPKHNPEYTLLEAYQAYADYEDMMELTEAIVLRMVEAACGGSRFAFRGREYDVAPPWPRISLLDAIEEHAGVDLGNVTDDEEARRTAARLGVQVAEDATLGHIIDDIFDHFVVPHLQRPTFVVDYPTVISPLAKRKADAPHLTDRFEPFIGGMEVGNAFSELNDPVDQRQRFIEQMKRRAGGDREAHQMDEDFLRALEYGMPPTGGLGLGIDRLVMILTDSDSLREVILFPLLRPEARSRGESEESDGGPDE
ncbi:MAG: lysine--tRNA ligase [Armatimonadota bacterium]